MRLHRPRSAPRARRSALLAVAALLATLLTGVGTGTAASAPLPSASAAASALHVVDYAPARFAHPGVLNSRASLDLVRAEVRAGAEPWKSAYAQMTASDYASLTRVPAPRAVVECGPVSNPDFGCTDERQDAIAAYTDALAWYISGDARYARKSVEIMDAWSAVITAHTNANAQLQTAWAGTVWPQAAEIIRYTYRSWPHVDRFATMLRTVYLPEIINGYNGNGNWELSMMDASVGISVFLNDKADYNKAVARYLNRVKAYVYLPSDGPLPYTVPGSGYDTPAQVTAYWQGQSTFVAGLTQETCRDFVHTGYGIAAIAEVAETSRIQGRSLYPLVGSRLSHAMEFQAQYQLGAAIPSWLCGGKVTLGLGPVTEVGLNELHDRAGLPMPNTEQLTLSERPEGTNKLFVAWETLTHADNRR